ncbi:MAG: metallophosphoesterase family protein [bacterium]
MEIAEFARKAAASTAEEFSSLVKTSVETLIEERSRGRSGELDIEGGLVYLPSQGKAIVVGDLHGDLQSLIFILEDSGFIRSSPQDREYIVFLGDYGDRGDESVEVYYLILSLKSIFKEKVILLRGNHEGPQDLGVRPHDLPYFLRARYAGEWRKIYESLRELFDSLLHSVIAREKYLMFHGGLPEGITSVSDVAYAHQYHPDKRYLEQILWSDPGRTPKSYPSPRGAGRIFGEKITMEVLDQLGVKTLIRSHEPCEGTSLNHKGKVLTLFSRKGAPYFNSQAAYLEIDLSDKAKSGPELVKEARYF